MKRIVFLIVLLSGCYEKNPCLGPTYIEYVGFNYDVNPTAETARGIKVDPSGVKYDNSLYDMIDRMTKEVEDCLGIKADRSCIEVKVPDNWFYSESDPRQQLLNNRASNPGGNCGKPWIDANESNECYWRAGLQDGYQIITTPNLYLYKDPLIKNMTGTKAVWNDYPQCATPGIEPDWM